MRVEASAPSNIALIKYMGKVDASGNLPSNASLSYTLEHLRSYVRIEPGEGRDHWQTHPDHTPLQLSEVGQKKFLAHFARLKEFWEIPGAYRLSSGNNFPSDCGLASSASSFAALTQATYELARRQHSGLAVSAEVLSRLSRQGSGSSCRSFFSPWALWRGEGAEECKLPVRFEHAVVVVEKTVKTVSSSQAHVRVPSSLLFQGRAERAERRLAQLMTALEDQRWSEAFELCWSEFWDMHALFETSTPAFGYLRAPSLDVLERLRDIWRTTGDGPLITMDAGPNIHLLLREDQTIKADEWLKGLAVIKSWAK